VLPRRLDGVDEPHGGFAVRGDVRFAPSGLEPLAVRQVVPDEADLLRVRIAIAHRHLIEGELAVAEQLFVAGQPRRGLVVVDRVHAVGHARQPIDEAPDLIATGRIERQLELVLEAQGLPVLLRAAPVAITPDVLLPGLPVVGGAEPAAHDRDLVLIVVLLPLPMVDTDDLGRPRPPALFQDVVQVLDRLVDPVPQERLDPLRVAPDAIDVAVAVLQRALLEAAEAGVGVDGHAAPLATAAV